MGKLKAHASGDNPPQHLPVFMVGRFQLVHTIPGKIWMKDTHTGEGGSYDLAAVEAALAELHAREF